MTNISLPADCGDAPAKALLRAGRCLPICVRRWQTDQVDEILRS